MYYFINISFIVKLCIFYKVYGSSFKIHIIFNVSNLQTIYFTFIYDICVFKKTLCKKKQYSVGSKDHNPLLIEPSLTYITNMCTLTLT